MKQFIGKIFTWEKWAKIKENIGMVLVVCIGLFCFAYFGAMILMGAYALILGTLAVLHGQGGIVAFLFICALWWLVVDLLIVLLGAPCNTKLRIWLGGSYFNTRNCNTVTGTLIRKAYVKFKSTMESWAKGDK